MAASESEYSTSFSPTVLLQICCYERNPKLVKILLDSGKFCSNYSAVMISAEIEDLKTLRILMRYKPDLYWDVSGVPNKHAIIAFFL